MAQTIIVSPTCEPVSLPQRHDQPVRWRCLARRGMVFSELEGFDYAVIAPAGRLRFPAHPYTELVALIAAGQGDALIDDGQRSVRSEDMIVQGAGDGFSLINTGTSDLEVVSVEIIPPRFAQRLPYRTPQIVELPQAVHG
jgi:uncharacterized cupin superfamily protein